MNTPAHLMSTGGLTITNGMPSSIGYTKNTSDNPERTPTSEKKHLNAALWKSDAFQTNLQFRL